jgi:O-antigen ligase
MFFIGAIIFIIFIYLGLRKPIFALSAMSALLPAYLLRFEIVGLPTTILEMIVLGMSSGWIYIFLRKKMSTESFSFLMSRLQKIRTPSFLFFLASVISVFVAPDLMRAIGLWRAYFLEPLLVFFIILATIKNRDDFYKIILGLSVSAGCVSIVAVGQKIFGLPIVPPWQAELRATSIFEYPNAVGLFLAPIIILLVGYMMEAKKITLANFYFFLVALLSTAAIVFAKSDGAVVGVIAGLATLLFFKIEKKYKIALVVFSIVALGLIFFNGSFSFIKEKLLFGDWSGMVRLTIWKETWAMLKDKWLFGAGLSGYPTGILPYHTSRGWMDVFLYPHNIFFNFWSELGILGLGAILMLLEKFYRICYANLRSRKFLAITAAAAMTTIFVHGLVDVPYFKNDLAILFWIVYSIPLIVNIKKE